MFLVNQTLLEPIPDALRWLREIRMENGKWARFVELGTNKALYYDRQRIRVDMNWNILILNALPDMDMNPIWNRYFRQAAFGMKKQ